MVNACSTVSEEFIKGIYTGELPLSEHCPSFPSVLQLAIPLRPKLLSICRNDASGSQWAGLFSAVEARAMQVTQTRGTARTSAHVLEG